MNLHRIFTTLAALAAVAYCHGTFGADRYISTIGSDANDGLTAAKPYATLQKALISLAPAGGTIYVAPGTYTTTNATFSALSTSAPDDDGVVRGLWFSNYQVTNAVQIIGTGSDPSAVVFKWVACTNPAKVELYDGGYKTNSVSPRLFYINHADAKLKNLTITGGRAHTPNGPKRRQESGGSNVFIDTLGGTLEDCVINDGLMQTWGVGGGNIQMYGGRVIRCKLTKGVQGGQYAKYSPDTDYNIGSAVYMKGGIVENSLITGGGNEYSGCTVLLRGTAKLLSCTIAGNQGYQCAGVSVQSASCEVRNCAIFNNTCASDASGYGHVYAGKINKSTESSVLAARFFSCAADAYVNDDCIHSAFGGFVDQSTGDYHLAAGSCCRDAAQNYSTSGAISTTELDGKARKIGTAEDIGCYEFDTSVFSVDFSSDAQVGLVKASGGFKVKFTAAVGGTYSGTLTYEWDFNGDGVAEKTVVGNNTVEYVYPDCGSTGYFTVKLKVTATSAVATATKTDYIHVAPENLYVSPTSSGGTFPYDTAAKAAANLFTVLGVAIDGCRVHMAAGEYVWNGSNMPDIEAGVTVLGGTSDPKDTVIRYNRSSSQGNAMILKVNHPDAFVANLTLKDGFVYSDGSNLAAGGLHVAGNGGTVSNCVIKGCSASPKNNSLGTAGVRIENGLLTHCVIEENCMYNIPTPYKNDLPTYGHNANSRKVQGLYATGPSRIENCLLRNMTTDGCLVLLGNNSKSEAPVMRNCTVTDCSFNFWTDNYGSYDNRMQWPCAAIECLNGNGKVFNTVLHNVKRRTYHDSNKDIDIEGSDHEPFSRNTRASKPEDYYDLDTDARCCTKCASTGDKKINSACVLMTSADFVDYEGGNLTPKLGGALLDAGTTIPGWSTLIDLAGNPRVKGKRIDIGCYEQQDVPVYIPDIYVDCAYVGESDGTIDHPWKTIKEGCANTDVAKSRILVRGGSSRQYVFNSSADTATVVADKVQLLGCDEDWNPCTGKYDESAMAKVKIADDYATTTKSASGNTSPLVLNAANCTVSGFAFRFGGTSISRQSQFYGSLIEANASGITVSRCCFTQTSNSGYYGTGSRGLVWMNNTAATGLIVSDCSFIGACKDGICGVVYDVKGDLELSCSYFTNATRIAATSGNLAFGKLSCISNVIVNSCNSRSVKSRDYGVDGFITQFANSQPKNAEIAYNIYHRTDYSHPNYMYVFIAHSTFYGGSLTGNDVAIHHNTIVGADAAFMSCRFYHWGTTEESSSFWTPMIFDNLVVKGVDDCDVIREQIGVKNDVPTAELFLGTAPTSFKKGSKSLNNVYFATFSGGPMLAVPGYELYLTDPTSKYGLLVSECKKLDAAPSFANTTNPQSENYFKLKVPQAPWVLNAWTGEDPTAPEFPRYIGAVEPQPGGFAVRIR